MATPGLSVWVVDDDESVRWVLEQALKQAHMFPRAFETGEEFFGALKLGRPDVLITDIRMPDMSGLELMERLTRTDPDIPVIVGSAYNLLRWASPRVVKETFVPPLSVGYPFMNER
jgi:two-component system nitrogen regulation response regulator GlnG